MQPGDHDDEERTHGSAVRGGAAGGARLLEEEAIREPRRRVEEMARGLAAVRLVPLPLEAPCVLRRHLELDGCRHVALAHHPAVHPVMRHRHMARVHQVLHARVVPVIQVPERAHKVPAFVLNACSHTPRPPDPAFIITTPPPPSSSTTPTTICLHVVYNT